MDLTARSGDILNQRTVTRHESTLGKNRWESSFANSAARIEATRDLTLNAGRDVHNVGGVLESRGDLQISAGRDVTLAAVEERHSTSRGSRYLNSQTTQLSSETRAAGNLNIQASRDLTAVASRVQSGKDMQLIAGNDLTLVSAANESHHYSKSKKATSQRDQVRQVGTAVNSGGQFAAVAGQDLTLVSSSVAANDEAYLVAGGKVQLLAEQDYDYSFSEKKKKKSFGRKSFKSDEHTKLTHVGSSIISGADLAIISGDEQPYQAANLNSGGDLTIDSGAGIVFEGVKDLEQNSRIRSKSNWAWQSAKGQGYTDETLMQSQLQAQGEIAVRAAERIQIDIKEVDQQRIVDEVLQQKQGDLALRSAENIQLNIEEINERSVEQAIAAMVQAEPQLAWLKDMQQREEVDWRQVKELHESFKYSQSGLSGPAAIAVAIVVAYATAGAASGAIGSMAGATAGSGTAMAAGTAAASAGWANTAFASILTSAASNTAISAINNKGHSGAILKDIISSDALKDYGTGAALAGITSYTDGWGREMTVESNYKLVSGGKRFGAYLTNTSLKGLLSGADDTKTWLTIAGTGALMELYQYSVGRDPDIRPGVDRPEGSVFDDELGYVPRVLVDGKWREGKNIGLNRLRGQAGCNSTFSICHGSLVSNGLNVVPGFNSFATLHDQWMLDFFEAKGGVPINVFENIFSMTPALFISYGALYEQYRSEIDQAKKINKTSFQK